MAWQVSDPSRPSKLQDRISRGLGTAARLIGSQTEAFRPRSPHRPLAIGNRFLRLPAAFSALDGRFARPNGYGAPLWHGVLDAAYTRPGDYLVQNGSTFFVAAQQPLLPTLCVQTNRVISIKRPAGPAAAGVNPYGGVMPAEAAVLLTEWPASVLGASASGAPAADLPADAVSPLSVALLPAWPGVAVRQADLVSDDLSRTHVVVSAELTDLGWRLALKQATT